MIEKYSHLKQHSEWRSKATIKMIMNVSSCNGYFMI